MEMERAKAEFGGFRSEDGVWKVAQRHADPISSIQPAASYEVE